ncbi:MAG: class II fructose-bisphosphate aldolase [Spirochaetes bacterium]|nr:class II fructose-bisphosphate aldolase [Spirochaetota bacterium]
MPTVTGRSSSTKVIERVIEKNVSMAIFCTASHWNTEAILLAAKKLCDKYQIESVPIAIAMTFNYPYMPQAQRVMYSRNPKLGFQSIMDHIHLLCDHADSPYRNIAVLPHLDHADPERDAWALTEGTKYLSSVMFDAQRYTSGQNIALTREYVQNHGKDIMVEGILEELAVADKHESSHNASTDSYPERAAAYVKATGIDFLVADLGTEQQASSSGGVHYMNERAQGLTAALGKKMLVLHGTSSLNNDQMQSLSGDGVVRVNMWTKIAREAGRYAAGNLFKRAEALFSNDFESVESNRYLMDSIEKASDMMLEILEILNYANFARA